MYTYIFTVENIRHDWSKDPHYMGRKICHNTKRNWVGLRSLEARGLDRDQEISDFSYMLILLIS